MAGWVGSLGDTPHKSHSLSDKPFEVAAHADHWDMHEGSSFCASKVIYFQGQSLSKWKHAPQHDTKWILISFYLSGCYWLKVNLRKNSISINIYNEFGNLFVQRQNEVVSVFIFKCNLIDPTLWPQTKIPMKKRQRRCIVANSI